MRITYDKASDSKYIAFLKKKTQISTTKKLSDWLIADFSKDGTVVGAEILNASKHNGALITVGSDIEFIEYPADTENQKFQRIEARTPRIDSAFAST
jgi:uncharacterized protein YuzE